MHMETGRFLGGKILAFPKYLPLIILLMKLYWKGLEWTWTRFSEGEE